MAEKGTNVFENWPKWTIALGIGTPVVLGLAGIWYYRRRSRAVKAKKPEIPEVKPSEAQEAAEEKPLSPNELAQSWKSKGNKYFKGEKYDKAIECYTEAIKVCPSEKKSDIATFYQNRAAAFDKLKKVDDVIHDCTEALKLNSTYTKALSRRAKAYETKGGQHMLAALNDITAACILEKFANAASLEMAERVLTKAAQVSARETYASRVPSYPSPHFISSYFMAFASDPILDVTSDSSDRSPDEKYTEETPEKELNQRNIDEQNKPDNKGPYVEAVHQLNAQCYDNLLSLCKQEVESDISTHAPEARLLRASLYLLRGESEKAMTDFNTLLNLKDVSKRIRVNAMIKRGSLLMQDGKETEALSDFAAAVREDQDNSDIYHHRGQMNLLMNRIEDAVRDFSRSVQLNPSFAIAHVQKIYTEYSHALMLQSPLQLAECMKSFEKAIARFPDCSEGYALYGQALADQQQFDEADNNFKKAIQLEPYNGNNYVHRGVLRLQWKQDIDESIRFIETALKVDSKCRFAYETLGTIEIQRGNLDKAIELFDKALKFTRTEIEMAALYKMYHAASAQKIIAIEMGIMAPNLGMAS